MNSLKIEFISEDKFTIYYISDTVFRTEEEFKILFKMLDQELNDRYQYKFYGFYNVNIYNYDSVYILDFELIDRDVFNKDFDITVYLNSIILYEFDDMDLINGQKIYYDNKFYAEIDKVKDDIRLFEYGKIVYGCLVDKILHNGIIID